VRYCRCDDDTRETHVKAIDIPTDDEEAGKFVRGAMLAFPELYFARFVVLVEGDSERIVLPRLAQARGLLVDLSFVAIVPLGGRHVQHFWTLLAGLSIPHATLLDLDIGRKGGGWGRIKTVIERLIDKGRSKEKLLEVEGGGQVDLANMHTFKVDTNLAGWVTFLRDYDVFFSDPVDLDMAMLKAVKYGSDAFRLPFDCFGRFLARCTIAQRIRLQRGFALHPIGGQRIHHVAKHRVVDAISNEANHIIAE
jgi:putative ATP-dependent endonuclease of OLD family